MESSEGRGIARDRWLRWWRLLPADVRRASDLEGFDRVDPREAPSANLWKDQASAVREQSELIGFWIAWHQAGGFQALEMSGWNRATIYRKLRLFRTEFGNHPDEHDFDWVRLDLSKCWTNEILDALGAARPAKSKTRKK